MALTTIPAAGAKLRGSVLSSLVTEVRPLVARKTVSENVNNSITFQNDDELTLAVEASATYVCTLQIVWSSSAVADWKIQFTVPTGTTTGNWSYAVTGATVDNWAPTTGLTAIPGTAATAGFWTSGPIIVSTTAGSVTVQWAQNTAEVSNTTVYDGSFMWLQRIS